MSAANETARQVLIVDDDAFNRDGMALYFQKQGLLTLEAGDGATAYQLATEHRPWGAVIDIVIPAIEGGPTQTTESVGVELVSRLKALDSVLGIVIFSAHDDRGSQVWELVRGGIRGVGYLLKGSRPERLLQALHDTAAGRVILEVDDGGIKDELIRDLRSRLTPEERPWVERAIGFIPFLSPRETEIANRLTNSENHQGIATALGITPKTVENHVSRIYDKVGLGDVEQQAPTLRKAILLAKAFMIFDLARPELNR